jgi:phosphoesterase RecJ-like protein
VIKDYKQLQSLVEQSHHILVLQPEKPDTDSLASSLVLEHLLGDLGKEVMMYCQDEIPEYLKGLAGSDRVSDVFPTNFDLTILVDAGGPTMLSRTIPKYGAKLAAKPFVIIDHHSTREPMPFTTIDIIDARCGATTELLVKIARQLDWKLSTEAAELVTVGIMADTLNLSTPTTTADTVETVAQMVRRGVSLYALRRRYEMTTALDAELVALKGQLMQRIEYYHHGKIALLVVTPDELSRYMERHDPSDLVINSEMRATKGVEVAVVIRNYGLKIKISMRANLDIAAKAASHFGGGGHPQAAGIKIEGRPVDEVKDELVAVLTKLIEEHEVTKHAQPTN